LLPLNPLRLLPLNPLRLLPLNPLRLLPLNPSRLLPLNPVRLLPLNPRTCWSAVLSAEAVRGGAPTRATRIEAASTVAVQRNSEERGIKIP
jgi:hypothetical protein